MFKDIKEVLSYIETRTNFQLGLLRVEEFIKEIDLDLSKMKFIHIGGTNGKGSCSNYLNHILINSKYKTGFFSSPSLICHNERIRINNQNISDEDIVLFVNKYYDLIEETKVTMFEIDVLMALEYFYQNNVEVVVFEVGMGGRYDGTNIVDSIVSVITNIGLDHTAYLGENKEEIAWNKAGIIKDDSHVVCNELDQVLIDIIKKESNQKNSVYHQVSNPIIKSNNPIVFDYMNYHDVKLKSKALYQVDNASLVIEVVEVLNKYYDFNIDKKVVYQVFENVIWLGRFEVLSTNPLVIIDGAHNNDGVKKLVETLDTFEEDKYILFSALKDKDTHNMISLLKDNCKELVITEFDFYRAMEAQDLAKGFDVEINTNYQEAIDNIYVNLKENDMLVITGSLYFISEVRAYFLNKY